MKRATLATFPIVCAGLVFGVATLAEDATVAAPDHYKVEFENDRVRVIRITYGPGEESAMHEHKDGVVIYLTDMTVEFTLPDGTTPPAQAVTAGGSEWAPAEMHAARNIGDEPIEALMIEFKD